MPSSRRAALYIHWPFCLAKCPYCDFNSHVRERTDHAAWREALLREMEYFASTTEIEEITSIFFGGGTPSLMAPETVAALIQRAGELWRMDPETEITLEANPTSVEAEKFRAFRAAGVNRVSLGVQSLREEHLRLLGREHCAEEARKAIALAAEHFPRYSFDLIYALPGQSAEAWETELREALAIARGHLSLYQLTIEEGTRFFHLHRAGKIALPEEETAARMFERTQEIMEEAGMPAYEISNHAAPGQESRHNLTYWRAGAYIGIGPGAHGRVPGSGFQVSALLNDFPPETRNPKPGTRLATATIKSPEKWLESVHAKGHGAQTLTPLTSRERLEEKVMMGLRLKEGVRLAEAEWAGLSARALTKLQSLGMLAREGEVLRVLPRGALCLTAITGELLA